MEPTAEEIRFLIWKHWQEHHDPARQPNADNDAFLDLKTRATQEVLQSLIRRGIDPYEAEARAMTAVLLCPMRPHRREGRRAIVEQSGSALAAQAVRMPEFSGLLDGMGLARLLSFLAGLRARGELSITNGDSGFTGVVFVQDGQVVGSTCGQETGMAALEAIGLVLSSGRFTFTQGGGEPQRNVSVEAHQLAEELEHLERERVRWTALIPSLQMVPHVTPPNDAAGSSEIVVSRRAIPLLVQIDGRRSVADLARQCGLRNTMQRISELLEPGIIQLEAAPSDRLPERVAVVPSNAPGPVAGQRTDGQLPNSSGRSRRRQPESSPTIQQPRHIIPGGVGIARQPERTNGSERAGRADAVQMEEREVDPSEWRFTYACGHQFVLVARRSPDELVHLTDWFRERSRACPECL